MSVSGPDEDTCNALSSDASCQDLSGCSWCTSGAVKAACHTVENAKKLPSSIFACTPLDAEKTLQDEIEQGFEEIPEEIEEDFEKFMKAINGPDEDTCNALSSDASCE